jgi:acyl transferase domain-containing protein
MAYRAFGVKSNGTPVQTSSSVKSKRIAQLVFIFTGQGAQWAQMGKELIRDFPSFSQDLERMQDVLARVPHPPSWRILG